MSRVLHPPLAVARRPMRLAILAASLLALPSMPAAAQELPMCDGEVVSDCALPPWPEATLVEAPSPFGDVVGEAWVEDAVGDAPPGALDILAVGLGTVTIEAPRPIRRSDGLLKRGRAARAVRPGEGVVVRIVLDRPLDAIEEGHSGIHLVTDIDGSRSNNAPAAVSEANSPWAGWQDVYSVTYATTTGSTRLFDTDLRRKWYKDNDPFAAAWAAPGVLDVLVRPSGIGNGFAVVTYVGGAEGGGYDVLALGSAAIPVDGRVGLVPMCTESSIATEPHVVRRLVENGQTLRNIEVPASWRAGASIPVDAQARNALESLAAAQGDAAGRMDLPSTVSIVEAGMIVRQRPEVALSLDGDVLRMAVELGLTRRGYAVLRDIVFQSTGDELADAFLERASLAFVEATPPFRVGRNPGLLHGPAIGACAPALIEAPLAAGVDADAGAADEAPAGAADDAHAGAADDADGPPADDGAAPTT